MPFDDRDRMSRFYQTAFGWQTTALGPDMLNYVLAKTAEPSTPSDSSQGAINGGFYQRKPDWPAQYPSVVIAVSNIDDAMQRISHAGGRVLGEPMEIPGVGRYVSFLDTEGNRISVLQPHLRA